MNIGSLYRVKKYYWLLFPSKESAVNCPACDCISFDAARAAAIAAYYSRQFKENVTYFSPDLYVVFLEEDGMLKKVLTSEGLIGWILIGWIWINEDLNDCFEEVKQQ